jgi:hypothetical protein
MRAAGVGALAGVRHDGRRSVVGVPVGIVVGRLADAFAEQLGWRCGPALPAIVAVTVVGAMVLPSSPPRSPHGHPDQDMRVAEV